MSSLRARWSVRNRGNRFLTGVLLISDLVCLAVAGGLAVLLRDRLSIFRPTQDVVENAAPVALAVLAIWLASLFIGGAYSAKQIGEGTKEYLSVFNSSFLAAGSIAIGAYLSSYDLARGTYVLFFLIGTPLLILARYGWRRITRRLRARGLLQTRILVAGAPDHVEHLIGILYREKWLGYRIAGALLTDPTHGGGEVAGIPVIGRPADALDSLQNTGAHGVIFAAGSFPHPEMFNSMARDLEDHKAQMIVMPALTDISAARVNVRPMAGIPLMFVEQPRARQAGSWAKRVFDIIGSALLILVSSPVMAVIAAAIKLEDGGPVLFRQRRTGLKGEEFDCLKFRSMVVDAEARLRAIEAKNEGAGVLFKIKDDPRVTRIGRLLRRTSLDELPQFFNVFSGRMSLVGPRPALPREVAKYQKHVLRRLDVRPGITGLWQVSGRSDLSWEDTVRLDLYYVDNWSMLQDLNIIGRTLGAVVRGSGAY